MTKRSYILLCVLLPVYLSVGCGPNYEKLYKGEQKETNKLLKENDYLRDIIVEHEKVEQELIYALEMAMGENAQGVVEKAKKIQKKSYSVTEKVNMEIIKWFLLAISVILILSCFGLLFYVIFKPIKIFNKILRIGFSAAFVVVYFALTLSQSPLIQFLYVATKKIPSQLLPGIDYLFAIMLGVFSAFLIRYQSRSRKQIGEMLFIATITIFLCVMCSLVYRMMMSTISMRGDEVISSAIFVVSTMVASAFFWKVREI